MNYKLIKFMYVMKRITAEDVWAKADAGIITETQAATICGPRM